MRRAQSVAFAAICVMFGAYLHAAEHTVVQKDKMFSTAALSVKVGDVVVFKNDDAITHNVFSVTKGLEFNTKRQPPGSSQEVVMKGEGTIEVTCAFHPRMKLTITVKK
jgi:plastocyanin